MEARFVQILIFKVDEKTFLIAGNPLEPPCHNVICKDDRDGLKSWRIGQSAAKPLHERNVQRLSRKGVHAEWRGNGEPLINEGEDIVYSCMKVQAGEIRS